VLFERSVDELIIERHTADEKFDEDVLTKAVKINKIY
jgi:hypothetical protein